MTMWKYIYNDYEEIMTEEEMKNAQAVGVAGSFYKVETVATPPEAVQKEVKEIKPTKKAEDKAE